MAHFVKIIDSVVVDGLVINNDIVGDYPDSEIIGQQFIASLGINGEWKQTSYNSNFRKQYAIIGGTYDTVKDIFIKPKPFESWSLDENGDWQAPIEKPVGEHYWNEEKTQWEPFASL